MKVVCDTNVLVAALVADGLCRDIVKRRLPSQDLFSSQGMLRELARVLRQKFAASPADTPFLQAYRERVTLVRPARLPHRVCRDPDDDLVISTAIAARTDCILTGDADLLVLDRFQGIAMLSPRAFVTRLDGSALR